MFPQAHLDIFCPFLTTHSAGREHLLRAALQTSPCTSGGESAMTLSQSVLFPHAQADGLGAEPSVVAQVGIARHLFWDR